MICQLQLILQTGGFSKLNMPAKQLKTAGELTLYLSFVIKDVQLINSLMCLILIF